MTESDRLIDEVLRLDESATKGPWFPWRLQNGRMTVQSTNRILYEDQASPCPAMDAMLVVAYRSSAPRLARMLRVALAVIARFGDFGDPVETADAHTALAEIEKIAKGEA